MAELHLIGQILSASDFEEPSLFCKWSIQYGKENRLSQFKSNDSTEKYGFYIGKKALTGNM